MRTFIKQGLFFAALAAFCMSGMIYAETGELYSCSTSRFAGYKSTCQQSPWSFGGHLESGLYVNQYGQKNAYYARQYSDIGGIDPLSGNTALLQNVRHSDFQLNQGAFHVEKKLSKRCCWDIGGRVDYVFGTDALYMQSAGLEKRSHYDSDWWSGDYYSALAQMYAEVGYGNLSIKIGKFLTPMGSDPIYSPDRFFYSLSKNFGMLPVTHTGVLATLDVNRNLSVFGGWTQGYNEFFESSENNAIISGFEYALNPCTTIGYSFLVGKNDYNADQDYFVNALYLKRKLGQKWDYTFEWVLNNKDDKVAGNTSYYGINNSLYYTINCKWSVGFRVEWMHANKLEYNSMILTDQTSDTYGLVLGANWKPCDWFVLRPEIRYDAVHGAPNVPGVFNLTKSNSQGGKREQLAGGFSAVVIF